MKTISLIAAISLISSLITIADEKTSPSSIKSPAHNEILKRRAELKKQNAEQDKKDGNVPLPLTTQVVKKERKGLLERSTLLASQGNWTLAAKGCVLYTPDHLKSKIVSSPGKLKLVKWHTFLRNNHGWIHTLPVTEAQARGTEKVKQETIKAYKTMGKVVIAIYKDYPVSVSLNSLKPEVEKSE